MKLATTIIDPATDDIIDKGRKIASFLLETGEIDIEFERGRYRVAGTDREVGIFEVAAATVTRNDLPKDLQGTLAGVSDQTLPIASFPYGAQVCDVEVDPEMGEVQIVRYAAVDDVGRAINPLILYGQTHGGIAQGLARRCLSTAITSLRMGSCWRQVSWITRCRAPTRCRSWPQRSAKCPRRRIGSAAAPAAREARHRRSLQSSTRSSTHSPSWG
jgi:hypothetical protein